MPTRLSWPLTYSPVHGRWWVRGQRGPIANSVPDETHVFYQPLPGPKDYMTVAGLKQLVVPATLSGNANETNLWHYDSSSTNRHNPSGYDLWAVYAIGNGNVITNGNW